MVRGVLQVRDGAGGVLTHLWYVVYCRYVTVLVEWWSSHSPVVRGVLQVRDGAGGVLTHLWYVVYTAGT